MRSQSADERDFYFWPFMSRYLLSQTRYFASGISATVRAVPKRKITLRAALTLVSIFACKCSSIKKSLHHNHFQTPSAVERVKQLLAAEPSAIALKVGVKQRGCNGLTYTLEYAKSKQAMDEDVVQDGARVLIDSKAQLSLLGTEMDFVKTKLSSEFVFNNPNIKGTCGCGESFNL